MLSRKHIQLMLGTLVIAGAVGGYLRWRSINFVTVDISAHDQAASINLAPITKSEESAEWVSINPGKTSLRKGAYLFRLESGDKHKTGLIAVNDSSKIVLK